MLNLCFHPSIIQVMGTLIHLTSNLQLSIVGSVHPLLTYLVFLQNLLHLLSHLSRYILKHRINNFQVTKRGYSNQQEAGNTTVLFLTSDKTELSTVLCIVVSAKKSCTVLRYQEDDHKRLSCSCSIPQYFLNVAVAV